MQVKQNRFHYGDLVTVHVPGSDATRMLLKYNGRTFRVIGYRKYKDYAGQYTYQLKGCEGPGHVPYCFDESWLREVRDD